MTREQIIRQRNQLMDQIRGHHVDADRYRVYMNESLKQADLKQKAIDRYSEELRMLDFIRFCNTPC